MRNFSAFRLFYQNVSLLGSFKVVVVKDEGGRVNCRKYQSKTVLNSIISTISMKTKITCCFHILLCFGKEHPVSKGQGKIGEPFSALRVGMRWSLPEMCSVPNVLILYESDCIFLAFIHCTTNGIWRKKA